MDAESCMVRTSGPCSPNAMNEREANTCRSHCSCPVERQMPYRNASLRLSYKLSRKGKGYNPGGDPPGALVSQSEGQVRDQRLAAYPSILLLSYKRLDQGITFMEWTAMSMRPSSRASSISFVNRPLPPMSASGWFSTLSPVVLMMQISRAPSSAN